MCPSGNASTAEGLKIEGPSVPNAGRPAPLPALSASVRKEDDLIPKGRHDLFGEPLDFLSPLWPTAHHELKRHVLHTDVLEFLQRFDQLLGCAFERIVLDAKTRKAQKGSARKLPKR